MLPVLKPIKITPEMVDALKRTNPFPEWAIGGESLKHPDQWLAHLREPFFIAKVTGDDQLINLQVRRLNCGIFTWPISLVELSDSGNLRGAADYLGVPQVSAELGERGVPEHLYVQHEQWIGIVHTRLPRFIYESKQPGFTLVLDAWDDIGPVLRRAADWYGRMVLES